MATRPPLMEIVPLHELFLTGGEIEIVNGCVRLELETERTAFIGCAPTIERIVSFRGAFDLAQFIAMNARHYQLLAPYRRLKIVG